MYRKSQSVVMEPEDRHLPRPKEGASKGDGDDLRLIYSFSDEQIVEKNRAGNTALHVGAHAGSSGHVEVLVQRVKRRWSVGDENWLLSMRNNDGNAPLHEVVLNRNRDAVGYLLDEDLEPLFWKNKQGKSTTVEKEDPLDLLNEKGQNILHVAAKYGRDLIVNSLLGDPRLEQVRFKSSCNVLAAGDVAHLDIGSTNRCQTAYDVVYTRESTGDFIIMRSKITDPSSTGGPWYLNFPLFVFLAISLLHSCCQLEY